VGVYHIFPGLLVFRGVFSRTDADDGSIGEVTRPWCVSAAGPMSWRGLGEMHGNGKHMHAAYYTYTSLLARHACCLSTFTPKHH
jgi:hypothetical protein